jgi:hypothetical protein
VQVGDVATLLYGVAALVGAIGSAVAVVINAVRSSRRERPVAARQALGRLARAAADGQISNKELASVLDKLRDEVDSGEADDTDESANSDADDGDDGDDATAAEDGEQINRTSGVLPRPGRRRSPPRRRRRESG